MQTQLVDRTYTVSELAEVFHRTPKTIRHMIERGDIAPIPRLGRFLLVSQAEVDRLLGASSNTAVDTRELDRAA